MYQTITFQKIGFPYTRAGKCTSCGKRRQVTRDFSQTVNPFNKNADGLPKSAAEIRQENKAKLDLWLAEPFLCHDCTHEKRQHGKADTPQGHMEVL